jgi:hypothetical protein
MKQANKQTHHMNKIEIYVGFEVHKETTTAAVAEGGRTGEVRQAGRITNDLHAVEKLLRRIRGEQERALHVCYEVGPCGFVIARRLKQTRAAFVLQPAAGAPPDTGPEPTTTQGTMVPRTLLSGEQMGAHAPKGGATQNYKHITKKQLRGGCANPAKCEYFPFPISNACFGCAA